MGYYTSYKLEYAADDASVIEAYLQKAGFTSDFMSYTKWYGHENDLRKILAEFPDTLDSHALDGRLVHFLAFTLEPVLK